MSANVFAAMPQVPEKGAVSAVWQMAMGADFPLFRSAFLQASLEPANRVPCPLGCGCQHEVVRQAAGDCVAVCRCEEWSCDDFVPGAEDLVIWKLNWERLARAVTQALELRWQPLQLPMPRTRQIGAWSTDRVPAILTLPATQLSFSQVVVELALRLQRRFILLSPTSEFLDAHSQEVLARAEALFVSLDQHLRWTSRGTLQSNAAPGKLFTRFQPAAVESPGLDVARGALALLQQLDLESPGRPPSVLTVFRLYCVEELSAAQVARRCRCSKTVVIDRLNRIRSKTGLNLRDLRRCSDQFDRMETDLADPRAKRIHRRNVLDEVSDASAMDAKF